MFVVDHALITSLAERPSAAAAAELAVVHGVLFAIRRRPSDHVCPPRFLRFAELWIPGYCFHKCFAQRLVCSAGADEFSSAVTGLLGDAIAASTVIVGATLEYGMKPCYCSTSRGFALSDKKAAESRPRPTYCHAGGPPRALLASDRHRAPY
jgi:hypothetical protein